MLFRSITSDFFLAEAKLSEILSRIDPSSIPDPLAAGLLLMNYVLPTG